VQNLRVVQRVGDQVIQASGSNSYALGIVAGFRRIEMRFWSGEQLREAAHRAERGAHIVYHGVRDMVKFRDHLAQFFGALLDQKFQLLRVRLQLCLSILQGGLRLLARGDVPGDPHQTNNPARLIPNLGRCQKYGKVRAVFSPVEHFAAPAAGARPGKNFGHKFRRIFGREKDIRGLAEDFLRRIPVGNCEGAVHETKPVVEIGYANHFRRALHRVGESCQLRLCLPPFGDVLAGALVVKHRAARIPHDARVHTRPDDGPIFAVNLVFKLPHMAFLLQATPEQVTALGPDTHLSADVLHGRDEFFG
jgi:hypothetical protein